MEFRRADKLTGARSTLAANLFRLSQRQHGCHVHICSAFHMALPWHQVGYVDGRQCQLLQHVRSVGTLGLSMSWLVIM